VVAPWVTAVFANIAAVNMFASTVPLNSLELDGFVVVVEETSGAALAPEIGTTESKVAIKAVDVTNPIRFIRSRLSIFFLF
jgi:hypothetical protein